LQAEIKDGEQQVESLRKIAQLASEATMDDDGDTGSSSYVSAEMARKATEESKAFEKEMKGASQQSKNYVKEILDSIQAERYDFWLSNLTQWKIGERLRLRPKKAKKSQENCSKRDRVRLISI
jgi:hypothetical protein